ncbi:uncharacterized protein B0I36DRAFT_160658 [Microdochium trichocladiopsis]|uniref:Alcohol acetyltransferase n=1 Tax=Microdochium trichocladiopsis TaxID=1682393 RepID=A0A9P8Y217_9PEZI|nr:uncharacterized protein B0I36DRAFT_160658 [Microdochium trichocladiopsis]KAH7026611.1 hypothetical protein B0I36DRAFT_160658 [Microdochium trichocladiopsis]
MASSSHIVRPVGTTALWNTARHSLGLYRCVINTSRYIIPHPPSTSLELQMAVQNALAIVVKKHGILRVGIVGEHSKMPSFVHIPRLELDHMIQWVENNISPEGDEESPTSINHLLRLLERQHDQLWQQLDIQPGWKLLVQENRRKNVPVSLDISLCFHHAYMDGKSSYIFHQDLLEALNELPAPQEAVARFPVVLEFPSAPVLPEVAETLIPFKTSFWFIIRTVWEEIIRDALCPTWVRGAPPPDTIPWTGSLMKPDNHKAHLRYVRISEDGLKTILSACRERRVTLTALLYALVAASLSAHLPAAEAPCFTGSCPISLSRYAKPPFDPQTTLHCLVTSCAHTLEPRLIAALRRSMRRPASDGEDADGIMWEISSAFSQVLRDKVAQLPQDDIVALTSWIPDWHQFFTAKFGKKRDDTFEISNLGSMGAEAAGHSGGGGRTGATLGDDRGRWYIDRAIFSQGAMPVGSAFALNVAGIEGQGVTITVNWQEAAVEAGLMDKVVEDLQRWVDQFPKTGRFIDALES